MKAKEASRLVKEAHEKGRTYARHQILAAIRREAFLGNTQYCVNEPTISLTESDYLYFENLGYKVQRESRKVYIPKGYYEAQFSGGQRPFTEVTFAVISWD